MIEVLKYGVSTLMRIKHPKIVSVLQPLEESRESLAYATEPLFTSLNSVLARDSSKVGQSDESMDFSLSDTEIKYGLVQLAEALNFLHCDCHRLHLNLTPESVVINRFGIWKLGGFEFSKVADQNEKSEQSFVKMPVWQSNLMPTCQLNLNASSPEAILQGEVTAASDMFSLGLLICALFNRGKSILDVGDDYHAYKRTVKQTPYFEDASMSVLRSVDNMYQLDNLSRSQFYKSLPNSIHALPKRLCLFRVFPQISEDFSNPHMVPFILPAVLQILDLVTQDEFIRYMLPRLIPVMSMKEPIQIILIFLQNLHILSEKFPIKEFRNYVLPMLQLALDIDNKMIQELCLKSLPTIGKAMDLTVLRNSLIPRIQRLCLSTEYLSTRMNCLLCIGKLLDLLDKWIVMDDILPFLQQIKSREPTILIAILGIYRLAFSHEKLGISREKLANKVLPYLIPLSIESSLNLKQYSAYASLIRDMCSYLEREQYAKLEQLHGAATDENSMIRIGNIDESVWATSNSCSDLMTRIICAYLDDADQYVKRSSVPTSLTVNSNNSNNTSPTSSAGTTSSIQGVSGSINNESTNLSLEQKRQLAAKKDQIERLSSNLTSVPSLLQPATGVGPMKLTTTTMNKPKPVDITNTLISYNVNAINSTSDMMNKSTTQPNRIGTGIPLALITPPTTQHQSYEKNGVFDNNNSLYYHSNNNVEQLQSTILPKSIIPHNSSNNFNSLNSIPFSPTNSNMMRPVQQQQPIPNAMTYQLFPTTSSITMPTPMFNQNVSNSNNLIKPLSKCEIDDLLS
ncbi:protein kinase [Schistosoma mansoni]|uniref:protein kinase n=1 Tax=Schistosoma mansoni TaxID=6183 RepID=UPI00022C8254|nr:protein kinase [Schistosoma mansoni]|eukprot:XP_018645621.1 protein kinase [Schistosoma mansoni]